jgi:hypothetical protein
VELGERWGSLQTELGKSLVYWALGHSTGPFRAPH